GQSRAAGRRAARRPRVAPRPTPVKAIAPRRASPGPHGLAIDGRRSAPLMGWSGGQARACRPQVDHDRNRQYGARVAESMRLPGAERATIPTDKLVRYALNPDHPLGRHKARVFASALGIRRQDWRYLHDQILSALPEAPVRSTRITPFGVTYEVI